MVWRDISETENKYQASECGQIRRTKTGRVMVGGVSGYKNNYRTVNLRLIKDGRLSWCLRYVHRLVAQTFVLNPDNKPQVNHIDGVPKNNHASNLEWVTPKENMAHAKRIGLDNKDGEGNPASKLTDKEVLFIRNNIGVIPQAALARMFKVSDATVSNIKHGRAWIHLFK